METIEYKGIKIIKCLLKDNYIYQHATTRKSTDGIVVHSTDVNQKWLGRYVQPSADDPYYDELIEFLGKNNNGNHWNRDQGEGHRAIVHFMIGNSADGELVVMQLQPMDQTTGGSWYGPNGSYNPTHLQFEILEDDKTSEEWFLRTAEVAAKLCAYICEQFGLDVDTICSHKECGERGYGSTHVDPEGKWWCKFNGDMDWFREQVENILAGKSFEAPQKAVVFERGDKVTIKEGATWANGTQIAGWLKTDFPYLYVMSSNASTSVITCKEDLSASSGTIYTSDLELYLEPENESKDEPIIIVDDEEEQELEEVPDEMVELEAQIVELEGVIETQKGELDITKQQIESLSEQLESLEKDKQVLEEIINQKDQEIASLKETIGNNKGTSLVDIIINFIKGLGNK